MFQAGERTNDDDSKSAGLGLSVTFSAGGAFAQTPPCAGELFPARSYYFGPEPTSVALGDVDGDDDLDVVVGGGSEVQIFLNKGDGELIEPAIVIPTEENFLSTLVETADLNGDGAADIVTGNFFKSIAIDSSVSVILTDGRGGFHDALITPLPVVVTSDVDLVDVTGDGVLDAVVAGGEVGTVAVLEGDEAGGLTPTIGYTFSFSSISSIAVADFNEDDRADLVVADSNFGRALLSFGEKDGTFDVENLVSVPLGGAWTVQAADMNDDDHMDFIVSNEANMTISILHGDGTGNFDEPIIVPTNIDANLMEIVDLNQDGREDVVIGDGLHLETLMQDEDGEIASSGLYRVGESDAFVLGDFNEDGTTDIVTAEDTGADISVVPGNGAGGFLIPPLLESNSTFIPYDVALDDVNNDGVQDLIVADNPNPSVSVLIREKSGGYAAPIITNTNWDVDALASADFNDDEIVDLVCVHNSDDRITMWLGNGTGAFELAHEYLADNPTAVVIEDFDQDGNPDAAVSRQALDGLTVIYGGGDNGARDVVFSSVLVGCLDIATADFNGDGWLDLCMPSGEQVAYALNDGTGSFLDGVFFDVSDDHGDVTLIEAGDLNDDGYAEIIAPKEDSDTVLILINDQTGGFLTEEEIPRPEVSSDIRIADFNEDDHTDFVISSWHGSSVTVYFGNGTGNFPERASYVAPVARAIDVRDVNEDGKPDIAFTSQILADGASVLINECDFSPPGDLDEDGDVDFTDLLALLASWGACAPRLDCPADLDSSGAVGFSDLLILLDNWT